MVSGNYFCLCGGVFVRFSPSSVFLCFRSSLATDTQPVMEAKINLKKEHTGSEVHIFLQKFPFILFLFSYFLLKCNQHELFVL